MMTNGFVALSRSILNSPIWKKPPYYIKIFLYLYLNAAYIDSDNLKRGEVIVNLNDLEELCSSGRGVNKAGPSVRMIKEAIGYLCSTDSGVYLKCEFERKNVARITFLKYDELSNSKILRPSPDRNSTESREKTTIIYNKNINNKNKRTIESRAEMNFRAKPTAFNNFAPRSRDYEEIKQKAKEKLKKI